MFVGVAIFWLGNKHYAHADVIKPAKPEDLSLGKIFGIVLLPALIVGYIGWILPGNIFGSDSTDAFIFGAIPVVAFYASLLIRSNTEDRKPLAALLAVFAVSIIFWAVFKQNGTAMTIWAENYTNRNISEQFEVPAKTLGMVQTVEMKMDSVNLTDEQFRVQKDEDGKIIKTLDYPAYFKNMPASEKPAEGESAKLISTEIFQSVNPFFVVILTPVVIAFFSFLRRRKKNQPLPGKYFSVYSSPHYRWW